MTGRTIEFVVLKAEDYRSPYVSIAKPDDDIARMVDPDECVIAEPVFKFMVEYPIENPHVETVTNAEGYTRAEVARAISSTYHRLYHEEDGGVDPGTIPGMYNRGRTNGPHGIWGHYIGDLQLYGVSYNSERGLWELGVDS